MSSSFFKRAATFGALTLALSVGGKARAQDAGGMPDLSDFAGAIAGAAQAAPPKKAAPAPQGGFKSGLNVPRVKPGEGARSVARALREKVQAQYGDKLDPKFVAALQSLEDAMPKVLTGVEGEMGKQGFAPRDMGNAYAFAFLQLHEDATGTKTPDAPSTVAARTLSKAVSMAWGDKYKTLQPAQQETAYESLIAATALNSLLIQTFDEAGKKDEADTMRQGSAQIFETLVGVPPTQVVISPEGQLSGLLPAKTDDAPATDGN